MMGKLGVVSTEEHAFSPAHNYSFKFAFHFYKLVMWPYLEVKLLAKSETTITSQSIPAIRISILQSKDYSI